MMADPKSEFEDRKRQQREQLIDGVMRIDGVSREQAEKTVREFEIHTIFSYRPFVD